MKRARLHPTVLALGLLLLTACAREPAAPPDPPQTYRTRGLVRQVSDSGPSGLELLIRHEAIPELKDDEGNVVGMDSMTMPFPVPDRALAEGVTAGDKVLFELEISWNGSPPLRVTRIEKLPPETELEFK